jgi:hypothetical protein
MMTYSWMGSLVLELVAYTSLAGAPRDSWRGRYAVIRTVSPRDFAADSSAISSSTEEPGGFA